MSAALDPHCWKATSLAEPEYVTDFTSPSAFCALAMTVFASCASALTERYARQIAKTAIFFAIDTPPLKTYSLPWNSPAVNRNLELKKEPDRKSAIRIRVGGE